MGTLFGGGRQLSSRLALAHFPVQLLGIVFLRVPLRLFLGLLNVAPFALVDVAGLFDLLAAALGLDEFLRRFAIVAVGRLVAFAFVAGGAAHGDCSSFASDLQGKTPA